MWIYITLLILHLIISALVLLGIQFDILKVHKYMFFVVLFMPVWGYSQWRQVYQELHLLHREDGK